MPKYTFATVVTTTEMVRYDVSAPSEDDARDALEAALINGTAEEFEVNSNVRESDWNVVDVVEHGE